MHVVPYIVIAHSDVFGGSKTACDNMKAWPQPSEQLLCAV